MNYPHSFYLLVDATVDARSQWVRAFKVLRENNFQSRILNPGKLSIKWKNKDISSHIPRQKLSLPIHPILGSYLKMCFSSKNDMSAQVTDSRRSPRKKGLRNLGNTCIHIYKHAYIYLTYAKIMIQTSNIILNTEGEKVKKLFCLMLLTFFNWPAYHIGP